MTVLVQWDDLAASGGSGPVALEGYLHPVEIADSQTYFVISPDPACCFGCLPRDPTRAVEVFAAAPVAVTGRRLRVTGRLRRLGDDDETGFRWQMRDARAEPAAPRAARFPRRAILTAGPLMCLAAIAPRAAHAQPAGAAPDAGQLKSRLSNAVTIDMHSHAGGLAGHRRVEKNIPFLPVAGPMREGGMAVACLAIVSDAPTHRTGPDHRIRPFRDPEPGELSAYGARCFERLSRLIAEQNLRVIATAADLRAARSENPAVIVSAEGADFLEGDIGRIDDAYRTWGLRHLQLTHYRPNELGDIQTEAPVHGGLTDFGAEAIRRCNALGIVVDVAHGTFALVERAAKTTTKPLILSHTSLSHAPSPRSRLISPEHARLIASTGGVVGIWPPASRFPTMDELAHGILAMAEVVGVDHVGLGSDMMGLTGPAIYGSYDQTPALAASLSVVGFSTEDVLKILGGNYVRVFEKTLAA